MDAAKHINPWWRYRKKPYVICDKDIFKYLCVSMYPIEIFDCN